jgi:hypothetical protein
MKKKKNIAHLVGLAILGLGIGFGVFLAKGWVNGITITDAEKAAERLQSYKDTASVCGKNNIDEYYKEGEDLTWLDPKFTCTSFSEAAKTPEERASEKEEELLRNDWFNYQYRGGVMSFDEWKDKTGSE